MQSRLSRRVPTEMFLATWTERGGTEENASEQRVGVEDEHGKYATSAVGQYSEASTVLKTDTARPVTPSHLEIALSHSLSVAIATSSAGHPFSFTFSLRLLRLRFFLFLFFLPSSTSCGRSLARQNPIFPPSHASSVLPLLVPV